MERPNPDDPDFIPDPVPGDPAAPKPRDLPPDNPQVIPLDEDKNLAKGIEIKET